ncbi:MAG: hypothetical protein RLZZ562_1169, partial [Planctomycetota bacterium]
KTHGCVPPGAWRLRWEPLRPTRPIPFPGVPKCPRWPLGIGVAAEEHDALAHRVIRHRMRIPRRRPRHLGTSARRNRDTNHRTHQHLDHHAPPSLTPNQNPHSSQPHRLHSRVSFRIATSPSCDRNPPRHRRFPSRHPPHRIASPSRRTPFAKPLAADLILPTLPRPPNLPPSSTHPEPAPCPLASAT